MRPSRSIRVPLHSLCQSASNPLGSRFQRSISLRRKSLSSLDGLQGTLRQIQVCSSTRPGVGEPTFSYALPCFMNVCYCKNEEEAELRFHPKCLYMNQPPPIDCDWLQEVVYNRIRFIFQLLEDKAIYWRAKCGTLLFEIGTAAFTGGVRQKRNAFYRNFSPSI